MRILQSAKRLTPVLLAAALLSAGCGGAATSGGTAAGPKQSGPVAITFWNSTGGDTVPKMVDKFNAAQSDVKVTVQFQGGYDQNHQKLMAAVAAGNGPDVSMIEAAVIRQFSSNGALADMDALMTKSNVDKTDFISGLLMDGEWGGKLYALPFNRSEPILYFNRTLLKEKGLDPTGPKTWDDLRKFAQVLTQRQGNEVTRYGFGVWGSNWMYEAMIAQAGGSLLSADGKSVTMNSQAGIDALSLWTDMALKDKTQMVPTGNNPIAELETAFLNGQVAMQYGSTGGLRGLQDKAKFDLGAAFLPMNKSYGVPTGGTSLVIMAGSKQQDAAFKFVNWMTSTEQSAEYSKATGYMPVRNSTIKAMADFWQTTPNFKVAVDQLAYVKPRPNSPVTPQIHALLDKAIARAMLGQQSPKAALDSVKADGDKLLGK